MSKTTRTTTTPAATSISEDAMRHSLAAYIAAYCEIEKIEAAAKARIEAIKNEAQAEAKPFTEQRSTHEGVVQTWASQNPERFLKPRKIEIYGGHKIGFDLGQPAVSLIKPTGGRGKQTWEGFIAACKDTAHRFARIFVRTIEEPDKATVLRWYGELAEDGPESKADATAKLADLGVKITQTERFVIDLNLQPDAVGQRA